MKKQPFTEEQEERIGDIAENKAWSERRQHEEWSFIHYLPSIILLLMLGVIVLWVSFIAYHAVFVVPLLDNIQSNTATLLEEIGWEKICVEEEIVEIYLSPCTTEEECERNTYHAGFSKVDFVCQNYMCFIVFYECTHHIWVMSKEAFDRFYDDPEIITWESDMKPDFDDIRVFESWEEALEG